MSKSSHLIRQGTGTQFYITSILAVALSGSSLSTLFLFKAKPNTKFEVQRYYVLHFASCLEHCDFFLPFHQTSILSEFWKNCICHHKFKMCFTICLAPLGTGEQPFLGCSSWGRGQPGGTPLCTTSAVREQLLSPQITTHRTLGALPEALHPSLAPNWSLSSTETILVGEILVFRTKCLSQGALTSWKLNTARCMLKAVQLLIYWRYFFS